jgi:hypothetical protein
VKSTHADGTAVMVRRVGDNVHVRSTEPNSTLHVFTSEEWKAFVLGVQAGELQ